MGNNDEDTSITPPLVSNPSESETLSLTHAQLQALIQSGIAEAMRLASGSGASSSTSQLPTSNLEPSEHQPSISRIAPIAFKPPQPLYSQNPTVWFEILEQQFNISNISQEKTRYSHALGALDSRLHDTFAELIIRDKGPKPYSIFKNEVIKGLGESAKTKLNNLLHGLTLGDSKPSQLLAKMRFNAGSNFNEESIKQLWLKRLPQQVQLVITAFENDVSLSTLAERADNIMETMSGLHINSINETPTTDVASSSASNIDVQLKNFKKEILLEISSMLSSKPRSRTPTRSNSRFRRFRSSSRNNDKDICYYHLHFGDKARKCLPFCKHNNNFSKSTQPLSSKND